jgi:lipopolysaccharide biosynthesis glycosyltransferase
MIRVDSVAFCVNRLMWGPMLIAVDSLVRSNPAINRIYVLHDNVPEKLTRELKRRYQLVKFFFRRLNLELFHDGRSLHGDYTTYGKFQLPDLVEDAEQHVLYLDADVIVQLDINNALQHALGGHPLYVVLKGKVERSLDREFYTTKGLTPDHKVFNAGVLLFHCPSCREFGLLHRALTVTKQRGARLLSADQPVFNLLFSEQRGRLPDNLNIEVSPETPKPLELVDGIFHFVGSPKPWDLLGSRVHRNFVHYERAVIDAGIEWSQVRGRVSPRLLARTVLLARSYWKCMRASI